LYSPAQRLKEAEAFGFFANEYENMNSSSQLLFEIFKFLGIDNIDIGNPTMNLFVVAHIQNHQPDLNGA
jgi:hypothetical protein